MVCGENKKKVKVYYNPKAGSGRAAQVYEQVQELLRTSGDGENGSPFGADDYIVIGGDGTFNTLLNELPAPEKHRYILLPAGTSNSLCSQLSPDEDAMTKLQRALVQPVFRMLDLPQIEADGRTLRFINEASAGFAAAIAREIEKRETKRFFNRLHLNESAYIATAFRCWRTDMPYFLSLCNNRRISGDLYPCVNANPGDGKIDVYELACPRLRLPFELTRLVRATADKPSDYVTRRQVAAAEWDFDTPLPAEIDGNPLPPVQHLKLSLYPERIAVC